MSDFYEILGIPRTASAEQIRAAHRALSRRYHPDTAEDGAGNPTLFAKIQDAYETLSVADFRRRYDHKQAALRGETPSRSRRRPPKSPCGACGKSVYASQLILYLGRYMCNACFERKQARDAKRPRLKGIAEVRWQLKRLRVWAQSHVAIIVIVLAVLGAAGARMAWVTTHGRHSEPTTPAPGGSTSVNAASKADHLPDAPPVTSSETADIAPGK